MSPFVVAIWITGGAQAAQASSKIALQLLVGASCIGAYFTRRKPVGGYLFIFFFQLIVGAVMVIGMAGAKFLTDSAKGQFSNDPFVDPNQLQSTGSIAWLLIGNLPFYVVTIVTMGLAFLALARRDKKHLKRLQQAYVVLLIASGLGVFVDWMNFREALAISIWATVWTATWCAYTFWSHRVAYVLDRGEWDFERFSTRFNIIEKKELSKINIYALMSAMCTALLIPLAIVIGDSPKAAAHWAIVFLPYAISFG